MVGTENDFIDTTWKACIVFRCNLEQPVKIAKNCDWNSGQFTEMIDFN